MWGASYSVWLFVCALLHVAYVFKFLHVVTYVGPFFPLRAEQCSIVSAHLLPQHVLFMRSFAMVTWVVSTFWLLYVNHSAVDFGLQKPTSSFSAPWSSSLFLKDTEFYVDSLFLSVFKIRVPFSFRSPLFLMRNQPWFLLFPVCDVSFFF